jgi:hypothetical protein
MNAFEKTFEIEDVASPLGLSADMRIAEKIHEAWQAGWRSKHTREDGTVEARPKPTDDARWIARNSGKTEVDIANTAFFDLPSNRQIESLDGAAGTYEDIRLEAENGMRIDPKDESLIELLAVREHVRWVARDKKRPQKDQQVNLHVDFNTLDEFMREEDRKVARQAVTEFLKAKPLLRTPEEKEAALKRKERSAQILKEFYEKEAAAT